MARKPTRMNKPPAGKQVAQTITPQDAMHPHWNSVLLFSVPENRVRHLHHGSQGGFTRNGNDIIVAWDDYPPDHFTDVEGLLVHRSLMEAVRDINRSGVVSVGTQHFRLTRVHVRVPGHEGEVELRLFTSDVPTFDQVFGACDYDHPALPATARTIIDLGANIGLASVFFALRYPEARILAVEPDTENFALLVRNTARFSPRVRTRQGAVWTHDGEVNLRHHDAEGRPLGAWGVQVAPDTGRGETTASFTMPTLMHMVDFPDVDILKCDIEGAEAELFTVGTESWLAKVGMLIIETHDGIRPGSEAAIRAVLAPLFEELPARGENFYFRRTRKPAR